MIDFEQGDVIDQSFQVVQLLGDGATSSVLLVKNIQNQELNAAKVYKKSKNEEQDMILNAIFQNQITVMRYVKHQHLVFLSDVRDDAEIISKSGNHVRNALILQYVGGGSLIDYIDIEVFSQEMARAYFKNFLDALSDLHNGIQKQMPNKQKQKIAYAHRDLKPQNILLTQKQFQIKITDFGFTCPIKGKGSDGLLQTNIGTKCYKAPEIQSGKYYGDKIDIYSSGVILLYTCLGKLPLISKECQQLIKIKEHDNFWNKVTGSKNLSSQYKDLIVKMIAYNPQDRPTLQEIVQHPWFKGQYLEDAQLKRQCTTRLQKKTQLDKKKQESTKDTRSRNQKSIESPQEARGDDEYDEDFMTEYFKEKQKMREYYHLQAFYKDDFIINQDPVYAVALLYNFFKNKQIIAQQDMLNSYHTLFVYEYQIDNDKNIQVQFSYSDPSYYGEIMKIFVKVGINKKNKTVISIRCLQGLKLYFNKILVQTKAQFAYCLVK